MIALLGMDPYEQLGWTIALPFLCLLVFALCLRAYFNSDDRRVLVVKWIFSVIAVLSLFYVASLHSIKLFLLYIPPVVLFAYLWLPNLTRFLIRPLTSAWEGGADEMKPKPFYFIAQAKRQQGLFEDAVAEVRRQLERFPGDVEGMMMLASIQAEQMHDLAGATETLKELLEQPGLAPNHAVGALQALADYQMNVGHDAEAARKSFEQIIELFPDTIYAHNAEQRLAHLDGVVQARDFREHAVFKVPSGPHDLGLRKTAPEAVSPYAEASAQAEEYVKQLEKYPADTEAREKLAMLYAEHFERLDLAVEQLEQLAALPNASSQHIAHWLNLLATVHIRKGNDLPAAESALHRIVDRFPNTALATRAITRLATIQGELRAASAVAASKALGVYEKDIGLKSGQGASPYRRS